MAIKVPPGQYPPFEVIDSQHHAGIIIITAAICLVITLVCLLIRVYVRVLLSPTFGIDDWILLAATFCGIVQSAVVFNAASMGFGTAISLLGDDAIRDIQKSLVASDVLYLVTLYLSRCCIVAIYQRLTPRRLHRISLWLVLALSTCSVITSIPIITADCSLNTPWVTPYQSCPSLFTRWQFITAMDVDAEMLLFLFSFVLVRRLQMPRKIKVVIVFSFGSRLPLIVFESLRLSAFHRYVQSRNPTFAAIDFFIWTQVALNYSIIACTVYCLRPFMNAIATYYGTGGDSNLGSSRTGRAYYKSRNAISRSQESHALQPLSRDNVLRQGDPFLRPTLPGTGAAETVVMSPSDNAGGRGNSDHEDEGKSSVYSEDGSTRMIIRKDVEYMVQREDR